MLQRQLNSVRTIAMDHQIPPDVTVIKHAKFADTRGYLNCLIESNDSETFAGYSLKMSHSKKNVARGLHWQKLTAPQEKVITLLRGAILDVLLNLNPRSPEFGQAYRFELKAEDGVSLVIPAHYGHGFVALAETDFLYLCKGKYSAKDELSLRIVDYLNEVIPVQDLILSEKDAKALPFADVAPLLS